MSAIAVLMPGLSQSKIPSLGFEALRAIFNQALPEASVEPVYLDSAPPIESDVLVANAYSAWGLVDIARTLTRWELTTSWRKCPVVLGGPGLYNPLPAVDLADYVCNSEGTLVALMGELLGQTPREWQRPPILSASNAYITIIMPTEGCRYRCSFCQLVTAYDHSLRHARLKAITQIIAAQHPRRIQLHAASILQHPEFLELTEELRYSGAKVYLGSMNLNEIDERTARALFNLRPNHTVAAENDPENDTEAYFGLESASDRVLRRVRKPLTVAVARNRVAILRDAGFTRLGFYLILGYPDCTQDDWRKTAEFLEWMQGLLGPKGMVRVKCTPFLPHIGTPDARERAPRYGDCLKELAFLKGDVSGNVRFDLSDPHYYLINLVLMRGGIEHTALIRYLVNSGEVDIQSDLQMDQVLRGLRLPRLQAHLAGQAPMDISGERNRWLVTQQLR